MNLLRNPIFNARGMKVIRTLATPEAISGQRHQTNRAQFLTFLCYPNVSKARRNKLNSFFDALTNKSLGERKRLMHLEDLNFFLGIPSNATSFQTRDNKNERNPKK